MIIINQGSNFKFEIESLEKNCLDIVYESLSRNSEKFINNFDQLSFEELYLIIAGQTIGRSSKLPHSIPNLVNAYEKNELDEEMKLELKVRVLSSNIFKKAFERINYSSIFQYLNEKNILFKLNNSPNSSDFSVFIDLDQFDSIKKGNFGNVQKIDGVLLNVETKTANGFSNLSDALSGKYFGKFQFLNNQSTYRPTELRSKETTINNPYLFKKYNTISPYCNWNRKKFLVVSIFVSFLSTLKDNNIFSKEFNEINGSKFDHYVAIICIPHLDLNSQFYDAFFSAGKSKDTEDEIPGDFRFQIYKNTKGFLIFQNLNEKVFRFRYLQKSGIYESLTLKDKLKLKKFQIP